MKILVPIDISEKDQALFNFIQLFRHGTKLAVSESYVKNRSNIVLKKQKVGHQ